MQKTIKDLVVSSSPVDIHNYLGKIVVTYAVEDEQKCQPIFEALEEARFIFCKNPIARSNNIHAHYFEEVQEMLRECSCFVVVISENLLSSEKASASNLLWYQVGQMGAKNAERIREFNARNKANGKTLDSPVFLPVRLEGSRVSLAGTPLQDLNIAGNADEMMRTLQKERFSSRLIKGNLYESESVKRFAGSRISYGSIKVSFDIVEKSFRTVQQIILRDQQVNISDNELDALIRKCIVGKVHLLSFGTREKMVPQYKIYEDEIDITPVDFPENFVCSKSYFVNKPDEIKRTGVHAVLVVEFIVPIHKLLGVYFKPYITIVDDARDSYDLNEAEMLELLRPTFTSSKSPEWYKNTEFDTYYDKEKKRLYFNLNNDKDKRLKLSPDKHLGEYADREYPQ